VSGNPVAKHRTTNPADALAEPEGRPKGFTLRPFQQELIDQTGAALKAKRSPLVVLPDGETPTAKRDRGLLCLQGRSAGDAQGGDGKAKLGVGAYEIEKCCIVKTKWCFFT